MILIWRKGQLVVSPASLIEWVSSGQATLVGRVSHYSYLLGAITVWQRNLRAQHLHSPLSIDWGANSVSKAHHTYVTQAVVPWRSGRFQQNLLSPLNLDWGILTGTAGNTWQSDGVGGCEWVAPDLTASWRIDGAATLTFEAALSSYFWLIQGRGELEFVASSGGTVSAWEIDGLSSDTWTGASTSRATWQVDGSSSLEWIVRPSATAESCLPDDGSLPAAPKTGSNYVF